ncbi:MAG: ABC transporter substrate-binding protein [Acidimicrobiia bacterium]|nr:ABC transporter substrate-binding protein [Acidimicrobiia bacterium]
MLRLRQEGNMTTSSMTDRTRLRRSLAALGLLMGLALLAAACGGGDTGGGGGEQSQEDQGREIVEEGPPTEGGQMIIGVGAETNGWSPQYSQFADAGQMVAGSMFEPLAVYDTEGEPQPWLLESWDSNDDFTEWTLVAKEGITFHNGEAFDAEAMRLNFVAAVESPLTGAVNAPNFDDFEVIDEQTLLVTTTFSWAAFPHYLTGQQSLMAAPEQQQREDKGTRNPIGTGAYEFNEWLQGDSLTVEAYDEYWGGMEGAPYLDSIEYRVLVDPVVRNNALETGDVDLILSNSPTASVEFRDRDGYGVVEDNFSEEVMIILNQGKPPFDNENARRALALGTDPEAIIDIIGEGITHTVTSPYPDEDDRWHVEDDGYPAYDPEAAEAALEAYEEETGESLSFSVSGVNNTEDLELLQVLASQWASLGIDAEIDTLEQSAFIIELAQARFEAAWFRMFGATDPAPTRCSGSSDQARGADSDTEFSVNFSQTVNPEPRRGHRTDPRGADLRGPQGRVRPGRADRERGVALHLALQHPLRPGVRRPGGGTQPAPRDRVRQPRAEVVGAGALLHRAVSPTRARRLRVNPTVPGCPVAGARHEIGCGHRSVDG